MAKEESGLGAIARNVGSTVLKALGNTESAGQIFDPVGNIVGGLLGALGIGATGGKNSPGAKAAQLSNQLGFQQPTPQLLENSQALPQNFLTPRNALEKFGQNVGSQAPFAALNSLSSGARVLPSLLPNILGNVAAQGAEAADIGEGGQQAIQLATELGTGAIQGGFKPGGLKKRAQRLHKNYLEQIPENAQTNGNAIATGIKNIEREILTETDPKNLGLLESLKKTMTGLLTGNENKGYKINPVQILESRTKLNEQIREAPEKIKKLLMPINEAYNNAITDAAVQYPLQVGDLRLSDEIYKARAIPNKLTKFFDKITDKLPSGKIKATVKAVDLAQQAFWQPVKGVKMIYQSPEVLKYYKEMGKAATKNNINAVTRFADKINNIVSKTSDLLDDTVDLDSIF